MLKIIMTRLHFVNNVKAYIDKVHNKTDKLTILMGTHRLTVITEERYLELLSMAAMSDVEGHDRAKEVLWVG